MPLAQGTIGLPAIYNGIDKIGKVYRGTDLCYQSRIITPLITLIERTIETVDTELTSEITNIGQNAFTYCDYLTSITLPNGITTLDNECFSYCTRLKNIQIPSSVTLIGARAFQECWSLIEINIPNGVTSIAAYAFKNCVSLPAITIPSSVTTIKSDAFLGCSKLTEMRIEATTPPTLSSTNAISTATTTIYVPASFVSDYKNTIYWKDLLTRETNPVTFVGY